MRLRKILIILFILAISLPLHAQSPGGSSPSVGNKHLSRGGQSRPMGPPPEAYAACEGKAAADQAQFTSPRGDVVAGSCESTPEGMVLRPDRSTRGMNGSGQNQGGGRSKGHQPPPEAYAACKEKNRGQESQMIAPSGKVMKGVCDSDGEQLVLRPYRNRANKPTTQSSDSQ